MHATAFRFLKHLLVAVINPPPACVLDLHVHESYQSNNNLFLPVISTRQDPLLFVTERERERVGRERKSLEQKVNKNTRDSRHERSKVLPGHMGLRSDL